MGIIDLFNQKGIRFSIEGNRPQMLDETGYVWLVAQGRISVFLAAITEKDEIGIRNFLFEAEEGDLLFGITPAGIPEKKSLLASGLTGSGLIRLEISQLIDSLDEKAYTEVIALVQRWLKTMGELGGENEDIDSEQSEIAASLTTDLLSEEAKLMEDEYIKCALVRESYNSRILRSVSNLLEKQNQTEKARLIKKERYDKRLMSSSISNLTSINSSKKTVSPDQTSGDILLDTCRVLGKAMNINIVSPPANNFSAQRKAPLQDIARSSRIRTRKVTLNNEWYKHDGGPILGYMEEDDHPVALIPASPSQYILHDLSLGIKKVVDKETAAGIKYFGFVFYRSFDQKKISLKEIVTFGWQSCWKRDLVIIILMGVLGGILGTAVPMATGIIFSSIIPEGEKGQLLQIAVFLCASALAALIFQFVRSIATLRMEGKMEGSIQASIWDRLLSLPVPFFKQFTAGELAMRAMGISQIRRILSGVTLNTILSSIFSVFTLALLFYYDSELAGVAVILSVIAIATISILGILQVRCERKLLDISDSISGMLLQMIGGVTKFQVAGAERRAFYRWSKDFRTQREYSVKRQTLGNWLTTFNAFFPILTSMVIFYNLVSGKGSMQPGQFIAFNSALINFMLTLAFLSQSIISANIMIPLYQRAKPILETLPESDDTKLNPKPLTGSIEVSHVSFRYKEDGPLVLQDVSFQIKPGEYVALVGTSGCGKSTLLRVLLGFEEPGIGKVYYNGQDLSKVDIRAIRRQIGVVLQNGQLMTGDIFHNIISANAELTMDDAWEAARMAGIEEDIKAIPMGMHTYISEGAGTISGGQKQRLMIARAIVNKPKIIFFDEATSALDNRTQSIVSKSLDQLQATRIVIAHRLSTIMNCSRILVMDKGRIVEIGTYQELIDKKGIFADLAKRQLA